MGYIEIKFKQLSVTFKIWPLFVSAASSLILPTHHQLTIHTVLFAVPLMCKSVSFLHAFAPGDLSAKGTPFPSYPVHL